MTMIEAIVLRKKLLEAKTKDPLITFLSYLQQVGVLNEEKEKEIEAKIALLVNEATDYAEQAPYAEPEQVMNYVYDEK